jgi:hypothetical protein
MLAVQLVAADHPFMFRWDITSHIEALHLGGIGGSDASRIV